jgi:hypothetical protein
MDAARGQGALRGARWADDPYSARADAESHAAAHLDGVPAGHQMTAFTVHRDDEGGVEDIAVCRLNAAEAARYRRIDLEGWHFWHPVIEQEDGTAMPARREMNTKPVQ